MSDKAKTSRGGCIFAITTLPFLVALRGLVVRDLWRWFVVPLGAPAINILSAIGLGMLVALMVYHPTPDAFKDEEYPWLSRVIFSALASLVSWGIGYLVAAAMQ